MKTTKDGKFLTTVPVFAWWLSDKIEERHRRKRAKHGVVFGSGENDHLESGGNNQFESGRNRQQPRLVF